MVVMRRMMRVTIMIMVMMLQTRGVVTACT